MSIDQVQYPHTEVLEEKDLSILVSINLKLSRQCAPPYLKHAGMPGQYYRHRRWDSRCKSIFVPTWLMFSVLFML